MGIGFSLATGYALKRVLNDFFVETNLVIVTAYLLFWVCEMKDVEFSGAIALVTFGVFMSAYGKTLISSTVEERLYEVINILERNAESILFIISGVLLADVVYSSSDLTAKDYGMLFLVFPVTYIIRFLVILCHYPILKNLGHGLMWKEFLLLGFGGMKGVISVGLALLASHDPRHGVHFRALVSYFGIGVAGLSILFGGLATRLSAKLLGLEDLTPEQQAMMAGVVTSLIKSSEKKIKKLKNNKDMQLINWDSVIKSSGPGLLIKGVIKNYKLGKDVVIKDESTVNEMLDVFTSSLQFKKKALEIEMRRRYLATLKKLYWENFSNGLCHGAASLLLIDSCNASMDEDSLHMKDWEIIRNWLSKDWLLNFFIKLSKVPILGGLFRKLIYKHTILAYDVANNFIKGHKATEKLLDKMEIDIDHEVFADIISEATFQVKLCEDYLNKFIIDCYPEILAEVQTKRCCKILLYSQREMIEEIYEKQIIKEVEYEALINSIDSTIRIITFQGIPSIPILKDIISNRFSGASPEEVSQLIDLITEKCYKPDDILFEEGAEGNGAHLIIRGRVNESSSWINQELIIGSIVGVQYLLIENSEIYQSTAVAITNVVAAHIPKDVLTIKGLIEEMYTEACEELIMMNRTRYELENSNDKHLMRVIADSEVKSVEMGRKIVFYNGALLLKGLVYEGPRKFIIKPSRKFREFKENSVVLVLPDGFALGYDKKQSLSVAVRNYCVNSTEDSSDSINYKILNKINANKEPNKLKKCESSQYSERVNVSLNDQNFDQFY